MRILQVNTFYDKVGGAEVYFHLLIEALRERGHEVAAFGGHPELEKHEELTRVVKRPDFETSVLIKDGSLSAAFLEFARDFRPDLVHVHNLYNFPADFPLTVAELGVPVVQTVHDWSQLCPNGWCVWPDGTLCPGGPGAKCFQHDCGKNYPFDARIVTAAVMRYDIVPRTFDAFLCPSQYLADMLTEHGYPNAEGLPLWANVEAFGEAPADGSQDRDKRLILFLGRLVMEKGVRFLVEAMPHVLAEIPDARLSIVGGGPEDEPLRALATELGLDESVTFHGKVPHEQVDGFIRRAAVQVLPSIWMENSPMSCYESFLAGLPMVASRIAGLPALVREGQTGLLAEPRDPADLGRKIAQMLRDDALRERLSAGCRAVLAEYTRDIHMDRVEAVYGELHAGRMVGRREPAPLGSPDAVEPLHLLMQEYRKLEQWAIGMKGHIDYLEARGPATLPIEKLGKKLLDKVRKKSE